MSPRTSSRDEERIALRRASVPELRYPDELPIVQKKDEILAAVRDHQVVVIAGETGSGKTTQLPKICLELGRGISGMIGHTQPRRLAARTVASRIADELEVPLGEAIGYQVRFTDRAKDSTLVKVMTDGILLNEIQRDRSLRRYDTLIIDEAHERSLNIDFILGYVKRLLPRRPDLKVIVTSATIDPDRFAEHFAGGGNEYGAGGQSGNSSGAPIIEVSGRTYPVEVRYRPILEDRPADRRQSRDEDRDQVQAILDAVDELEQEAPGDILVFLSGEREIRDTADALSRRNRPGVEILPLYARLSSAEQYRVFQPSKANRRIVLATNVAETSLTVPGIKYVIDPGTARISRYSNRLKVQRLPIEPISQASAKQRAGRCGRTSDGICIRLYEEEDFEARPEFTDPEILRTNLASVLLQMAALRLGDLEEFPFIEPPDRRHVRDGVLLLEELGAFSRKGLTGLGRKLARLPIDPRLGRMILEAERNGCVHDVLVITSALSIQDPRERPTDQEAAADQKHARFKDKESDFSGYLLLWRYLQEQQDALSSSRFRRMCRDEFLHYLRVREWQDLYAQLRQVVRSLDIEVGTDPAPSQAVHVSLLAGLLSHLGVKDSESYDYLGARGARFAIFPGSALFKKSPEWLMSAELVETSRLWARVNAKILPEWAEPLAQHLVKRSYSEPRWEKQTGSVVANERVTLYGLPIVASRKVNYGRIEPNVARELFIRHALVEGEWETRHKFFEANRRLLEAVESLEDRTRRRDILVDDEVLYEFYDQRVGPDVVSAQHFDKWWNRTRQQQPDLLTFERSMLIDPDAAGVDPDDFPDVWRTNDVKLRLSYRFEPGAPDDGVSVTIPIAALNQVEPADFDWQIPGLRPDLVTELIRSLPKPLRRNFVPAPNFASSLLEHVSPSDGPLLETLSRELTAMTGVVVPLDAWDVPRVPDHLRMTFRVVGERRQLLAEGKDLAELKVRLRDKMRASLSKSARGIEQSGLRTWSFGEIPRSFERRRGGVTVKAYPSLVDEGSSVAIRLLDTEAQQAVSMRQGVRRLLQLSISSPAKWVLGSLSQKEKLALSRYGRATELFDDCEAAAIDSLMARPPWTEQDYRQLYDHVRGELADVMLDTVRNVAEILMHAHEVDQRLETLGGSSLVTDATADVKRQLNSLVYPGFVTATAVKRLPDVGRYLRAMEQRLDKLATDAVRDRDRMLRVQELESEYRQRLAMLPPGVPADESLREVRWMLEELRVSLFAQRLGTPYTISEKRIRKVLAS